MSNVTDNENDSKRGAVVSAETLKAVRERLDTYSKAPKRLTRASVHWLPSAAASIACGKAVERRNQWSLDVLACDCEACLRAFVREHGGEA